MSFLLSVSKKNMSSVFFQKVSDHIICKFSVEKISDTFVFENDNYFIHFNGVIVNLDELLKRHHVDEKELLLIKLFESYGLKFANKLRGTFSIILVEKKKQCIRLFSDHISSKTIFYLSQNDYIIFGSNLFEVVTSCRSHGILLNIDWRTFSYMSKYGHMPGDATFLKEIKKIQAGHYISYFNTDLNVQKYYEWSFGKNTSISFDEAVDELQNKFKEAVRLNFVKDTTHNKKHIGSLSGGLDSRMTLVTAKKIGYDEIAHFTFSAPGYWDEVIAKQIAKDLKFKSFIFPLETRENLKDSYDEIFEITSGIVMFHLISHLPKLYKQINFNDYGVFHTGQIGDAIIGNTLHRFDKHHEKGSKNAYFNEQDDFINKIWEEECDKYMLLEKTQFYNHVFNFALHGDWVTSKSIETLSPFLNLDVMEFCLNLPISYRHNHKLYLSWIKKYYPKTGKYYYEKTKKVTFRNYILPYKLLRRIQLKLEHIKLKKLGLSLETTSLLGVEDLISYYDKENLRDFIINGSSQISDKKLKNRIITMSDDVNIHAKYLAYHIILTLEKYQKAIS